MARLAGGVGVIKVGAFTETEMKAKKFKIEDALKRNQGRGGRGDYCRRRRGFGKNCPKAGKFWQEMSYGGKSRGKSCAQCFGSAFKADSGKFRSGANRDYFLHSDQ